MTAVPNRPLTSGDNLWTDQDARAELHVGSTAIRLAPQTSVTLLDLDDRTTQLRLSEGTRDPATSAILMTAIWSRWTLPTWRLTCNAPANTGSTLTAPATSPTSSVWSGRGEVTGGGYSYTVVAGQSARFSGTDQLNYDIAQMPRRR